MKTREERRFRALVRAIDKENKLAQMQAFIQHGSVTTYDHVLGVAWFCYRVNRRLRLTKKETQLVRDALLHDYYLYDWHDWDGPLHGPYHPKHALQCAKRDFVLTEIEENIIRSHMWPLTLFHYPKTREAILVCIADKIVSAKETLFLRRKKK